MYYVYRKSEYLWKSNSILAYDPHTQTLNNFQPVPTTKNHLLYNKWKLLVISDMIFFLAFSFTSLKIVWLKCTYNITKEWLFGWINLFYFLKRILFCLRYFKSYFQDILIISNLFYIIFYFVCTLILNECWALGIPKYKVKYRQFL